MRETYAKVASANHSGQSCGIDASCCGTSNDDAINTVISSRLGCSQEDLHLAPSGADMGFGRANPRAISALKRGGRLAISDGVATIELNEAMRSDADLNAGCMGNASLISDLQQTMVDARFEEIRIRPKDESKELIKDWAPGHS